MMMNSRPNRLAKTFFCLLLVLISAGAAPVTVLGRTQNDSEALCHLSSTQGVKFFRQREYANAIKMFEHALQLAETVGLSPEWRANEYVFLCTSLMSIDDYKSAHVALEKAERLITENKVDNPALRIRLLRRKNCIEEHSDNLSGAAATQMELCELYQKNIGRLLVGNFSEMMRLQHLELKAKHYKRSIEVGNELLQLLADFRMPPEADTVVRANLTQGVALIFAGQRRQGCDHLKKMYEPAVGGSDDLAAYAAAWLVCCARSEKNEAERVHWISKLDAVAEGSHRSRSFWLERIEREERDGPH